MLVNIYLEHSNSSFFYTSLSSQFFILLKYIIAITGVLINADYYNEIDILLFINSIKKIAPVYYVTGNHEVANKNFSSLEQKLRENGIKVLRNSIDKIERNGCSIWLMGIDDPITTSMSDNSFIHKCLTKELKQVLGKSDTSVLKYFLLIGLNNFLYTLKII